MISKLNEMEEESIDLVADILDCSRGKATDIITNSRRERVHPSNYIIKDIIDKYSVDSLVHAYRYLTSGIYGSIWSDENKQQISNLVSIKKNLFELGKTGETLSMKRVSEFIKKSWDNPDVIMRNISENQTPESIKYASRINDESILNNHSYPKASLIINDERAKSFIYKEYHPSACFASDNYITSAIIAFRSNGADGFLAISDKEMNRELGCHIINFALSWDRQRPFYEENIRRIVSILVEDGADWHKGIIGSNTHAYALKKMQGITEESKIDDVISWLGTEGRLVKNKLKLISPIIDRVGHDVISKKLNSRMSSLFYEALGERVYIHKTTKKARTRHLSSDLGI